MTFDIYVLQCPGVGGLGLCVCQSVCVCGPSLLCVVQDCVCSNVCVCVCGPSVHVYVVQMCVWSKFVCVIQVCVCVCGSRICDCCQWIGAGLWWQRSKKYTKY